VRFNVTGPAGAPILVAMSRQAPPPSGPSLFALGFAGQTIAGVVPASRLAELPVLVPSGAAWAGKTFYFKAFVGTAAGVQASNWAKLAIP
jgi:hypothetical protein